MNFDHDEMLTSLQATAARVGRDACAGTAGSARVGRDAAVQAGLLELCVDEDGSEEGAPGALAWATVLMTLAQEDAGLAAWVWAQNIAQTAFRGAWGAQGQAWQAGEGVALPLDLELGVPGQGASSGGFWVGMDATHALRPRSAEAWSVVPNSAGRRSTLGLDSAAIGTVCAPEDETSQLDVGVPAFDLGVVGLAAIAVGVARRAADIAASYALEREQFGHPIADFQAIQFMIADAEMGTGAARLMVSQAAQSLERGELSARGEATRALCFAAGVARQAADSALQIHGGSGYTREYPAERLLRDASLLTQVARTRSLAAGMSATSLAR